MWNLDSRLWSLCRVLGRVKFGFDTFVGHFDTFSMLHFSKKLTILNEIVNEICYFLYFVGLKCAAGFGFENRLKCAADF